MKQGRLAVISGFSGVGKGTVVKKLVEEKGYEPDGDGTVNGDVVTVNLQKIMGDVTVTYKSKRFNLPVETKSLKQKHWIKETEVTGKTLSEQAPLNTVNSVIYKIDDGPFVVTWNGNSGAVNATVSSWI